MRSDPSKYLPPSDSLRAAFTYSFFLVIPEAWGDHKVLPAFNTAQTAGCVPTPGFHSLPHRMKFPE